MKTEMKHTKGKWFCNYSNLNLRDKLQVTCVSKEGSVHICDCDTSAILLKDEKRANAKLIAAAPDMLEALDNFIRAIDLITSKEGRKYMESGRLKAYDSLKNSLTYKTAIEAINKATL